MKPTLVLDCSMAMAWCFADEGTQGTAEIQDRLVAEAAIVPGHWFLEVANVLALAEKRQRISAADVVQFVKLLAAFDIQVDNEFSARAFDHILPLSRGHGLTTYDAAYLDLAIRRQLPLASLDDDLCRVAAHLDVAVLGK
ncbi:MAG: type II toxin-antitoxin system VapC family toxin [Pirellulaceae bacterium]